MSPSLSVAIIILNWNNAADSLACLDPVSRLAYDNYEVILVDNGSADGTVRAVREHYPAVTVLENPENLGFAGGNNVGIRYALARGSDLICILNNDVIVTPDFLRPLAAVCQDQAQVGAVTPLLADMANPERVWALGAALDWRTATTTRLHAGEAIQTHLTRGPFEVGIAPGAALLFKREVIARVGLLDEKFFLYYEETDWCLRLRRAGYRILAVPASLVWHKVSATLGQTSPLVGYYMARNQLRFIGRNRSGLARLRLLGRAVLNNARTIAAFTLKSHGGQRLPQRNARLLALRDAALGRWGQLGPDVAGICGPDNR
jgi:GT2 family glycosyltransferase